MSKLGSDSHAGSPLDQEGQSRPQLAQVEMLKVALLDRTENFPMDSRKRHADSRSVKVKTLASLGSSSMETKVADGIPDMTILDELVRRIVEVAHPEKIILFGSAARGEMGPDSDLDILVVKDAPHGRETARRIRRALLNVFPGHSKDIVVVSPAEVERYGDVIGYIIRPALREGRVLYAT